jgi:hypothetical protein
MKVMTQIAPLPFDPEQSPGRISASRKAEQSVTWFASEKLRDHHSLKSPSPRAFRSYCPLNRKRE